MLATYVPAQGSADDPEEYQAQYGDAVGSEDIVSTIRGADQDDTIKAIMMEVDSSGGYPVAGEEVANALKESTKPTVVVIRQSGLSAAYWASTGATQIFASRNSDVGSIGVTSSYLDNVGKNQKDGNAYVQLSSGKYKDAGDPDRPLTEEERQLFLRDIKITHQNFIEAVATNRNIPVDQVRAIADGSSVLGEQAKSLKLVDQIGGWFEAEKYIEQQIGEKPEVCWY
jgi:protease-4